MTRSLKGKQFQDDWWKIRILLKPKIYNSTTNMTLKTWKNIKTKLKKELELNGYESALEMSKKYINQ